MGFFFFIFGFYLLAIYVKDASLRPAGDQLNPVFALFVPWFQKNINSN
jgi:hypothetical protein